MAATARQTKAGPRQPSRAANAAGRMSARRSPLSTSPKTGRRGRVAPPERARSSAHGSDWTLIAMKLASGFATATADEHCARAEQTHADHDKPEGVAAGDRQPTGRGLRRRDGGLGG